MQNLNYERTEKYDSLIKPETLFYTVGPTMNHYDKMHRMF